MTAFGEGWIVRSRPETPLCQHIQIALSPEIAVSYQIPGQYAVISAQGQKEGFFALANKPGQPEWDFLVKKSSPLAACLAGLPQGAAIPISAAQGSGYDVTKAQGRQVLLLCVGSGIAPIRALIQYLTDRPGFAAKISLYYGAIAPNEFAYQNEFACWKGYGVTLVQTVYPAHPEWSGHTGFVQDQLPRNLPVDRCTAYLCGMQQMIDASREKLLHLGLAPTSILTNF